MPIALIIIGIILTLAGGKNTAAALTQTITGDFSGAGSFWYWIVAVIAVGSVGYYQPTRTISHLFLGLIVVVFILSNGGVYQQLVAALQNPTPEPSGNAAASGASGTPSLLTDPIGALTTGANQAGQAVGGAIQSGAGSILNGIGGAAENGGAFGMGGGE